MELLLLESIFKQQSTPKWNLIIGMLNNRDIKQFVSKFKNYINVAYTIPIKSQNLHHTLIKLALELNDLGLKSYPTLSLEHALNKTNKDTPLLITGSLYLAGEVLKFNKTIIN